MQDNGMKLLINHSEQADSVTGVGWCLERPLQAQLHDVPDLFVLLVTVDTRGTEVDRQVLPLEQMMTFVNFQRAGKNSLYAAIVHPSPGYDDEELKKALLKEGDYSGEYRYRFVEKHEDTFRPDWIEKVPDVTGVAWCALDVVVPKELFAKPPAGWLSAWVNRWFRSRPKDQCDFRKRMILAFTLQPLLLGLYAIICPVLRLVWWVLGLFFGMRKLRFSPIFHPFRQTFDDIWNGHPFKEHQRRRSVFLYDKNGRERSGWMLVIYPPILTIALAAAALIAWKFLGGINIITLLYGLLWLVGGLVALVIVVAIINWVIEKTEEMEPVRRRHKREARERARQEKLRLQQDSMALLGCDRRPTTIDLRGIPKPRRTVWLRFQSLKARVCRPYAG